MIDAALLLPKILAQTGDDPAMKEVAATTAWSRAAGLGLRRHAIPFRLHGKTLIVSVADAIWQRQLHAMSSELIFRINKLLRQDLVDGIEFRIDRAVFRGNRLSAEPPRKTEENPPLPNELVSAAAEIGDTELRDRFIRAAENCIARREARTHSKMHAF